MDRFVFLTFDGLAHGLVYSAFALALVLIWRGTRVLNFAQGVMAVACVYVAYSVMGGGGSYWAGFAAALAAGLIMGAVVERVAIRPVEDASPLTVVMVALGLALFLQGLLGIVYGNEPRNMPRPYSQRALTVGSTVVGSPFDLFTAVTVLVLMAGLGALFAGTRLGLGMRASAFAPAISRLVGVRISHVRTLGWGLASTAGALAALLAAPELGLTPSAMDVVFVSAFTGAVAGGLDSPLGAVVGGLGLGLVLAYVTGYLGAGLTSPTVLVLLIAVLLVRPEGVFSPRRARRV